jgi:hypothetical protein
MESEVCCVGLDEEWEMLCWFRWGMRTAVFCQMVIENCCVGCDGEWELLCWILIWFLIWQFFLFKNDGDKIRDVKTIVWSAKISYASFHDLFLKGLWGKRMRNFLCLYLEDEAQKLLLVIMLCWGRSACSYATTMFSGVRIAISYIAVYCFVLGLTSDCYCDLWLFSLINMNPI